MQQSLLAAIEGPSLVPAVDPKWSSARANRTESGQPGNT
jgi:hypothetical protein